MYPIIWIFYLSPFLRLFFYAFFCIFFVPFYLHLFSESFFCIFLVRWLPQRTLVPSFFYLSIYLSFAIFPFTLFMSIFMWFIKLRAWVDMCGMWVSVWVGVHGYAGMNGYAWVCAGMCGCVWDEFSEYWLETWVLTSADFNMYPIWIFFPHFCTFALSTLKQGRVIGSQGEDPGRLKIFLMMQLDN